MRTMRIRRWSWLLAVLLVSGTSMAGTGDEGERQDAAEKADKTRASEGQKPSVEKSVSPIYKAAQRGDAKGQEPLVFTNEDLERMWQNLSPEERRRGVYQAERHLGQPAPAEGTAPSATAGAAPPGTEEATPPVTPLDALKQERAATASRQQQVVEARKRVTDLEQQIADLERAKQAIRNPLLPKTWRKPESEGEEQADQEWDELNNVQRLEQTEERLKQTQEKLQAAREDLGRLGER